MSSQLDTAFEERYFEALLPLFLDIQSEIDSARLGT